MLSILLYVLIFSFSLLIMTLYQYSNNKNLTMFYIVFEFFILFIPLVIRYDVGADYLNYTRIITGILENNDSFHFEIGWLPLLYFMKIFNIGPHFFFVFTSLVVIILILASIPKQNASVGICLYLCLGYIELYSVVRQCFGATIFAFYLSKYAKYRKMKYLYLGSIIGFLFHKSILFLLPIVFMVTLLANWNKNMNNKKNVTFFIFLIVFFSFFHIGTFVINSVLPYTSYAVYAHMGERLIGAQRKGSGIGVLLRYSICFGILFYLKPACYTVKQQFPMQKRIKIWLTYVQTFLFVISNEIAIFMRLPLLLNTSLCVLYENKSNRIRKLQNFALILASFLLYLATILKSTRDIKGSWQLLPYYTIFPYLF